MPVEFPTKPNNQDNTLLDPLISLRMLLDPENPLTQENTPSGNGRLQVDMLTQTHYVPNPNIEAKASEDQPKDEALLDLYLKAYRALGTK
jgi:hypothetical protein